MLIAGASLLVGYLAITHPPVAMLLAATPALLFLIARPSWAAALGVSLVPVLHSLVGSEGGSVVVSPSDAVFLLTAIGIFPLLLLVPEWHARLPAMRTLFLFSLPWLAWLLVILAAHSSVHSAFKTMTAIEVTVFPVLIGACVLDKERARWALYGYLASAGALAILWIGGGSTSFAGNKNAAGQHLALAVLLTIVLARGRLRGYAVVPLFVHRERADVRRQRGRSRTRRGCARGSCPECEPLRRLRKRQHRQQRIDEIVVEGEQKAHEATLIPALARNR